MLTYADEFTYALLLDSHYDALKDMTANGYATALLLEDDAVLHERFPSLLQVVRVVKSVVKSVVTHKYCL
jgi:GR25 family glycosyltransferase involved in LPS biosynthesis